MIERVSAFVLRVRPLLVADRSAGFRVTYFPELFQVQVAEVVLADLGCVDDLRDAVLGELTRGADAGEQEDLGSVHTAGREDDFALA